VRYKNPCKPQGIENEQVEPSKPTLALQDICFAQPALLVGLISVMTGHALQEDIVASARLFLRRGQDILHMKQTFRGLPDEPAQTALPRGSAVSDRLADPN